MAWTKTEGSENVFEKIETEGIIDDVCISRPTDTKKVWMESLELKLKLIDINTGQPMNKERTIFLNCATKDWKKDDNGTILPPGYSEANSLIVAAGMKKCHVETDIEILDPKYYPDKIGNKPFEPEDRDYFDIYDIKFEPSIIGARVHLGVRESKSKKEESAGTVYKNYVVEEFEMPGEARVSKQSTINQPEETNRNRSDRRTDSNTTKPEDAQPDRRGRRTQAPHDKQSDEMVKLGYDARLKFYEYLRYHTEEINPVMSRAMLLGNMELFDFGDEMVSGFIVSNIDKLIEELEEDNQLIQGKEKAGKFRYIEKTE